MTGGKMGDRLRFEFKDRKTNFPKNKKNSFTYSEEKFEAMVRRLNRRQLRAQKENLQEMDIDDLHEYMLENGY